MSTTDVVLFTYTTSGSSINGQVIDNSGVTLASLTPNPQTVIGPVSSVVGNIVLWNNTTGTLVADSGTPIDVSGGVKTLVNNTTTTVVTPTIVPGNTLNLIIRYGLKVNGGSSDVQSETNTIEFSVVNKGGTYSSTVTSGAPVQVLTAGTLTTSWTVGASGVLQVNSNSTLSTPTLVITYHIENISSSTISF
jgi:hypothetical protein